MLYHRRSGAGKTLAGLSAAQVLVAWRGEVAAAFTSGNGPLVRVLREAIRSATPAAAGRARPGGAWPAPVGGRQSSRTSTESTAVGIEHGDAVPPSMLHRIDERTAPGTR